MPTLFLLFLCAPLFTFIAQRSALLPKLLLSIALTFLFFLLPNGSAEEAVPLNWAGALHNALFFWSGIVLLPCASKKTYRNPTLLGVFILLMGIAILLFACFGPTPSVLFINAIAGSAAVIAIALLPWKKFGTCTNLLSKNSYQIYLFSWFPQQLAVLAALEMECPLFLEMLFSTAAGICVPVLLVMAIRRSRSSLLAIIAGMNPLRTGAKN